MFRTMIYIGLTNMALCVGVANAGALEQLSQGGLPASPSAESSKSPAGLQGFWLQPSHENGFQPAKNENYAFQVRYYKLNWQHKKYVTFRTFVDAKGYMLKMKLRGYYADLAIHELPKRRTNSNDWLP